MAFRCATRWSSNATSARIEHSGNSYKLSKRGIATIEVNEIARFGSPERAISRFYPRPEC